MVVSKVDQKFCQKSAILLPLLVYLLLQLAIFLICYHFWPTVQATPSRRIHLVSVGNYATSRFFVHFYYHSFNRPCLLVGPDPLLIFVMGILYLPARYHLSTSIPSTKHRTYIMSQIISALVHKYRSLLIITKKNSCIQSQYEFKVFITKCEFSYVIFSLANSSFSARPSTLNQLFPNSVMTK